MCPRTNELHLAGEDCRKTTRGIYLITTNGEAPFALGQWTRESPYTINIRRDPFFERIDTYGKLESAFNFKDLYYQTKISSRRCPLAANAINSPNIHNEYNQEENTHFDYGVDRNFDRTKHNRKNDRFILVESPLATHINRTLEQFQQQSSSSDEFRFPEVSYLS